MITYIDEATLKYADRLPIDIINEDPYFRKYKSDIEKFNSFLKSNNIDSKTDAEKIFSNILRVLDIISNFIAMGSYYVGLGTTIVKGPTFKEKIIFALIMGIQSILGSLIAWGFRTQNEKVCLKQGIKILAKYNEIISKTDNKELKDKLISNRDKLKDSIDKMERGMKRTSIIKK